ncbi:guanine nucleotide exchange factor for Rab-3A [Fopius arisanus]|uniref:Guanine nucleotide exchange factor for Rab-3A n=2 Tax=Fopius arisanus TaxID=64838 RepID=A0A9R1U863_9HYME|nr:PREDICTED: guanine nucleotide exchange factor for Rab-3A-like [Fopius arisanus]XP_011310869.1 PREDICTED: guanine nucleotide exchange factor for Rab-3A-like [Fopius arisanus]
MKAVEQQPNSMDSSDSVTAGSEYAYRPLTTKHRRAGSTGTTGDEEYTTDEDELYPDEADCTGIAHHQPNPILKSDLARAATDLFGYSSKGEDNEEPTSLFDEDDSNTRPHSSQNGSSAHFMYNEKEFCHKSAYNPTGDEKSETHHLEDVKNEGKVLEFQMNRPVSLTLAPEASNKSSLTPAERNWEKTVAEVKEHAITKLQDELKKAHEELKLKDEEVTRLLRFRQDVETELEELTASLFQEAHNMVREANTRQATAEKLLEESRMKVEVLAAEVVALKTLVLTSTPAQPNPHLHPQIDRSAVRCKSTSSADETGGGGIFTKKHRRSPSHMNLKYGRENSPPESPVKEKGGFGNSEGQSIENSGGRDLDSKDSVDDKGIECERIGKDLGDLGMEIDPRLQEEFLAWKAKPCLSQSDAFVGRVFREDIDLCLDFPNAGLGVRVRDAVLGGVIFIEAVGEKGKLGPQDCALLGVMRLCQHRMRLGDHENQWHTISQVCRNRITAVCDFLNYLRYVERGLVKSSAQDVYWEIARLRKEMVLARLGLPLSS